MAFSFGTVLKSISRSLLVFCLVVVLARQPSVVTHQATRCSVVPALTVCVSISYCCCVSFRRATLWSFALPAAACL
jgi:hypothetical protein